MRCSLARAGADRDSEGDFKRIGERDDMPIMPSLKDRELGDVEIMSFDAVQDERYLSHDGTSSWDYLVNDGSFVVRAGSDVRMRENKALLPPIAMRRRRLDELVVLGELPGAQDR